MKKLTALLCMALVLALAGCNGSGNAQQTTAATTAASSQNGDGKVSQVAYEATETDRTEEALNYIAGKAPLFKKYLEKRVSIPVTIESETTSPDGSKLISGTYIKDDKNAVVVTTTSDGDVVRVIYSVDTAYQVESSTKSVFKYECGEKGISNYIKAVRLFIDYDDVVNTQYSTLEAAYDGVLYNREALQFEDAEVYYYFDKNTDDLVYIVNGETVTKITRFESAFTDDSLFDLPADYTVRPFDDLQQRYLEERQAAEAAAKTE